MVIDESDMARLGIKGVGDTAEITGRCDRAVSGRPDARLKSLAGPYVFCSLRHGPRTAAPCCRTRRPTFWPSAATRPTPPQVVEQLQRVRQHQSAFTSDDFSFRSRMHWLTKTKAGIALGYAAALGLLVGAVVTYQTLSAATKASLREYAVLRALGIPRWRMAHDGDGAVVLGGRDRRRLALAGACTALALVADAGEPGREFCRGSFWSWRPA